MRSDIGPRNRNFDEYAHYLVVIGYFYVDIYFIYSLLFMLLVGSLNGEKVVKKKGELIAPRFRICQSEKIRIVRDTI